MEPKTLTSEQINILIYYVKHNGRCSMYCADCPLRFNLTNRSHICYISKLYNEQDGVHSQVWMPQKERAERMEIAVNLLLENGKLDALLEMRL